MSSHDKDLMKHTSQEFLNGVHAFIFHKKKLKIPLNKVAIELNKKIIDKKKIKKVKLNNNDILEIVHFIGGG